MDRITLTVPADRGLRSVATLVLGGLGSRLDLPYERMDDLQLAVLSLMDAVEGEDAEIEIEAGDGMLAVTVGPLDPESAADAGLARVLGALVEETASARRDGSLWTTVRVSSAIVG